MHPFFERPARLAGYLGVAAALGTLLAVLLEEIAPGGFRNALAFTLPMAIVYAFSCLSVWYPVRSLTVERSGKSRTVLVLTITGFASAAVWTGLGFAWAQGLASAGVAPELPERYAIVFPLFFVLGLFLFALAVLLHLLFVAVERSREAERRALELQVHAREAELRSLKAQLDPHFLFNSLNSISALVGSDPQAARRMCLLLAGFFRKSLGLGNREAISLSEEMYLAETYLAIEEVRFGKRLRVKTSVAEETLTLSVPPLVLQPLVENAVHHGIAHLVEGGEIVLAAERRGGRLHLEVANPCDPDRPVSKGAGVGLANVRQRLTTLFGTDARFDVETGADRFRVALDLPVSPARSAT